MEEDLPVDDSALSDLQSLVDLFLDQEEVEDEEDRFLVFLRLSPVPEYLVKGYDFKMLNKFVDFYVMPTHNLSLPDVKNATFHHSRLMGVSDIENAVSQRSRRRVSFIPAHPGTSSFAGLSPGCGGEPGCRG